MTLKEIHGFCRVLASPVRLKILALLARRPLCVNALARRLDLSAGAVSQHLRLLREEGLVIDDKRGLFVHYRRDDEAFRQGLEALRRFWEKREDDDGGEESDEN